MHVNNHILRLTPLCALEYVVNYWHSTTGFVAGDKSAAIDYYSKGVSELEKGIAYKIHAQGLFLCILLSNVYMCIYQIQFIRAIPSGYM